MSGTTWAAPKLVKIKLTGAFKEDIEMTVGNSGRTEVISNFPYFFQIAKEELPTTLKFRSNNYNYIDIYVPAKPTDDIGHVYLVKPEENYRPTPAAPEPTKQQEKFEVKGIDTTQGINKAPYTGKKKKKNI
jgi:hypothetical protein